MSEELYWEYWMKYCDDFNREVERQVREHEYKMARGLLMDGISVDVLDRYMKIPREDLLRMKDELDGKTV